MSKNKEGLRPQEPKTIKVKTLLIAIAIVATHFAVFVGGWTARSADQARVQAEASELAQQLKAQSRQ